MTHLDIMAYLKVVKKEYCAFLQVPTNFSVAHYLARGECAQRVCSKKFHFKIDIIIELFMKISDFFEQSVILRPFAANFVWLKVGATRCILNFRRHNFVRCSWRRRGVLPAGGGGWRGGWQQRREC